MSNRWSGQAHQYLRNTGNGLDPSGLGKGNRDSVGTTDSTASEDDPPPPLPVKTREADYCNLPDDVLPRSSLKLENTNNFNLPMSQRIRSKPPAPPEPIVNQPLPPTPPPKPKRPAHSINRVVLSTIQTEICTDDSSTA